MAAMVVASSAAGSGTLVLIDREQVKLGRLAERLQRLAPEIGTGGRIGQQTSMHAGRRRSGFDFSRSILSPTRKPWSVRLQVRYIPATLVAAVLVNNSAGTSRAILVEAFLDHGAKASDRVSAACRNRLIRRPRGRSRLADLRQLRFWSTREILTAVLQSIRRG